MTAPIEALAEEKRQLELVIQASRDGFWDWNLVTGDLYLSPRWHEQLGYEVGDLPFNAEVLQAICHPEDYPRVMAVIQAHLDGEADTPYEVEHRFKTKSGKWKWILARGKFIRDAAGKPVRMIGTATDIHERKLAERELLTLKTAIDQAPVGIALADENISIYYCNPEGLGMRGGAIDDLVEIPKNAFENWQVLRPNGEPYEIDDLPLVRTISSGEIIREEFIVRHQDGSDHICDAVGCPVIDKGKIIGGIVIFLDISERKKAEEEARENALRLREAISAGNVGLWDWDLATNEVFYSKEWKMQIGYEDHEIASDYEEWRCRVHPDDLEETLRIVNGSIERGSGQHETMFRLRHKDGSYHWILAHASMIQDEAGKPVRMVGSHIDITERKLTESRLQEAQKLESIGTLAGGIAHDFNNLLAAILVNVSLARSLASTESEIFELLGEAESVSQRAQALTKQLLTFAKGGLPVKETANVDDILKESVVFLTRGSRSKCKFSIAEDVWPLDVDVGQIIQVISNVLINADQAMPEGGIIHVRARNVVRAPGNKLNLAAGKYVQISIEDEGIGIPEKYLAKVFDPYFSTKQEGSGLGLAISFSIMKRHGGVITASSVPGEGTTFHLHLPASSGPVSHREAKRGIRQGEGRILVMDDEAALRRVLKRLLDKLGYEAEFAEDGAEAIEKYTSAMEAKTPFHAVILDLTIPGGMGGQEALRRLKEADPEVRAIVSSGYSEDPVMSNYQEFGFKGVMPKPFDPVTLSEVLREVLA